jgi:hypothetical protein
VQDQQAYYSRQAVRNEKHAKAVRYVWRTFYVVAIGIAAVNATMHLPSERDYSIHPVTVTLALAVVAAGLWRLYVQILGISEQSKQYRIMAELFASADAALQDALRQRNVARALAILLEVGQEALAENGEWLLLHRERPIELPRV